MATSCQECLQWQPKKTIKISRSGKSHHPDIERFIWSQVGSLRTGLHMRTTCIRQPFCNHGCLEPAFHLHSNRMHLLWTAHVYKLLEFCIWKLKIITATWIILCEWFPACFGWLWSFLKHPLGWEMARVNVEKSQPPSQFVTVCGWIKNTPDIAGHFSAF